MTNGPMPGAVVVSRTYLPERHDMNESTTSRREADRLGVLDNQRAAHAARLDASAFEAIAAHVTENPAYGRYAEQAAQAVRRGYVSMCMELLSIADCADSVANDFRSHLAAS